MWSAQGVQNLKESLKQPGVKFEQPKKESEHKIFHHGQETDLPTNTTTTTTTSPTSSKTTPSTNTTSTSLLPQSFDIDPNQIATTTQKIEANGQIRRLVLDSGAFITGTNLTLYGADCEYYTLPEVIAELKDENAKLQFRTFPFPIITKSPTPQSLQYINNISTQTGDYHVLSLTDRKVLALCHQLEIESHGAQFIKENIIKPSTDTPQPTTIPTSKKKKSSSSSSNKKSKSNASATTISSTTPTTVTSSSTTPIPSTSTSTTSSSPPDQSITPSTTDSTTTSPSDNWSQMYPCKKFNLQTFLTPSSTTESTSTSQYQTISETTASPPKSTETPTQLPPIYNKDGYLCYPSLFESYIPPLTTITTTQVQKQTKVAQKTKFSLPGFDDGEWVSPTTMNKLTSSAKMGVQIANSKTASISSLEAAQLLPTPIVSTEPTKPITTTTKQPHEHRNQPIQNSSSSVGCITTDYSMQNVMLQCGLRCLTLDGRAISTIRQYIMGCHACYTLSKDMSRGFCPSCGGFTMVRIIVNVDKNGNAYYNWPTNRIENTRGTIFQISQAQIFGKKGNGKIILREDMLPKPKLKELLIARGEKVDKDADKSLFDDAALFGFMRQFQQRTATYGFGKKNTNIARRSKK